MKKCYVLLLALIFIGSGYGQYLSYEELTGLLKIANNDAKVDKYLLGKGFKFLYRDKQLKRTGYYAEDGLFNNTVIIFKDGGKLEVAENSYNIQRWDDYKKMIEVNGYKQTKIDNEENGDMTIFYQNKEFKILLLKGQREYGEMYWLSISKLRK